MRTVVAIAFALILAGCGTAPTDQTPVVGGKFARNPTAPGGKLSPQNVALDNCTIVSKDRDTPYALTYAQVDVTMVTPPGPVSDYRLTIAVKPRDGRGTWGKITAEYLRIPAGTTVRGAPVDDGSVPDHAEPGPATCTLTGATRT